MAKSVKNSFTAVATTLLEILNISLTTDDDPRLTPIPKHTRVVHRKDPNVANLGPATTIYSNGTAPYDIVRFFTHRKNADGKLEYCALPPPSWEVSASLTKPVRDSLAMLKKGKAKNLVKSIEQLKVTANWKLCKNVVDGDEGVNFVPRYAIDKGVDSDGKLWLLTIWNPIWFSEKFARDNYGVQLDEYLAAIELQDDQPQQPEPSKAPKRKNICKTPSVPKRQSRRGKVDRVSTETAKSVPFEASTSKLPKRPRILNSGSGLKKDDQMDVQSESAIGRRVVNVFDQPEIEAAAQVESVVETAPLTSSDAASTVEPVPVLLSSKHKLLTKLASKLSCRPSPNLDLNNDDQDDQAGDSLVVTGQPVASVEEEGGLAEANNPKVAEPKLNSETAAEAVSVAAPVPALQNVCQKNTLATSAPKLTEISSSESGTSIDSGNGRSNSPKVCVVPPATPEFKVPISASVQKRKQPTKGIVSKVGASKTAGSVDKYHRSVSYGSKSTKPKTDKPKMNSIPVHKMLENWNAEQRKQNEHREKRLEGRKDNPQPSVSSSSSVTSSSSSSTTRPSSASKRSHDNEPSTDVAAFKRYKPIDTHNSAPQARWSRSTNSQNRALPPVPLNRQLQSDMNMYRKSMEIYQRDMEMYNAVLRQNNSGGNNPVFIEPSKAPTFPKFFGQRVPSFGANVVTDRRPDTPRLDTPRPMGNYGHVSKYNLTLPYNERYFPVDNAYYQPSSSQSYRSGSYRNESRERAFKYDRRFFSHDRLRRNDRRSQSHDRSRRDDRRSQSHDRSRRDDRLSQSHDRSRRDDRRSQSHDRSRRDDRLSQSHDRSRRDDRLSQSHDRSRRDDRRSQSHDRSRRDDRRSQSHDRSRRDDRRSQSHDRSRRDDRLSQSHDRSRRDDRRSQSHDRSRRDDRLSQSHDRSRRDDRLSQSHDRSRRDDRRSQSHDRSRRDDRRSQSHDRSRRDDRRSQSHDRSRRDDRLSQSHDRSRRDDRRSQSHDRSRRDDRLSQSHDRSRRDDRRSQSHDRSRRDDRRSQSHDRSRRDDRRSQSHDRSRRDDRLSQSHDRSRRDDRRSQSHDRSRRDDRRSQSHDRSRRDDRRSQSHDRSRRDDRLSQSHDRSRRDDRRSQSHDRSRRDDRLSQSHDRSRRDDRLSQSHDRSRRDDRRSQSHDRSRRDDRRSQSHDRSRRDDRRSQSHDRSRRDDRLSQSHDRSRRDDRRSQSHDRSRRDDRLSQSHDRSRRDDRRSQSHDRSRRDDRRSPSIDRVDNHRRRKSSYSHRHDSSKHHRSN